MSYGQSGADGAIFNENYEVVQGLRITAHKTASYGRQAPHGYFASAKSKQRDLLSSAGIAAAMMVAPSLLPSSITGGADIAWASCDVQSGSTYLCSGTSIGDSVVGSDLNVTADGTYQVKTNTGTGPGLSLAGDGVDLILDLQSGSEIDGGGSASVLVNNAGTGATAVTTAGTIIGTRDTGEVSGIDGSGMIVRTGVRGSIGQLLASAGTDLTITQTAGSISGDWGLSASNGGMGATTITTAGNILGTNGLGVGVTNELSATDLTINQLAGSISSGGGGIGAWNYGSGATTITTGGDVVGTNAYGIWGGNDKTATDLTITQTSGAISSGGIGIWADNDGTGATTITTSGVIASTGFYGIRAINGSIYNGVDQNSTSTDLTITQIAGSISADGVGIAAHNYGTGATTITIAGSVAGANTGTGVVAENSSTATNLTVNQATGLISGGISTSNFGTGATSITTSGDVTGGVWASNHGTATDLIITQTVRRQRQWHRFEVVN